jgi:hypothetical protein
MVLVSRRLETKGFIESVALDLESFCQGSEPWRNACLNARSVTERVKYRAEKGQTRDSNLPGAGFVEAGEVLDV